MFDTLPYIGRVWWARRQYRLKCEYIDGMPELLDRQKRYQKELARAVLMGKVGEYIAEKRKK